MYAIQASITVVRQSLDTTSTITKQVPTFYLDESVLGFQDADGAKKVALEILYALSGPELPGQVTTIAIEAVSLGRAVYARRPTQHLIIDATSRPAVIKPKVTEQSEPLKADALFGPPPEPMAEPEPEWPTEPVYPSTAPAIKPWGES